MPPSKELFTLDEIIERWRAIGCDRATLLDYARRDLLIYSVYLRDIGHHRTIEDVRDGRVITTHSVAFRFQAANYEPAQVRYLKADDARRVLESQPGEQVGVSVLYSDRSRLKSSGTGYLQALYFTPSDLLITLAERDLFEFTHKLKVTAGRFARALTWLGDQPNQRALAILGGGLSALAGAAWVVFTWWVHSSGAGK